MDAYQDRDQRQYYFQLTVFMEMDLNKSPRSGPRRSGLAGRVSQTFVRTIKEENKLIKQTQF